MPDSTSETDHSAQAERLLEQCKELCTDGDEYALAAAQVHATLAIAAGINAAFAPPAPVSKLNIPSAVACPHCGGYVRGPQWIGRDNCSILVVLDEYDYDDPGLSARLERDPLDDPTRELPPDITRETPRWGPS